MKILKFQVELTLLVILGGFLGGCSFSPYTGDMYSGEPHGYGTYRYEDGTVYEGQFRYGWKYGFGTITHPDGTTEKVAYHQDVRIYSKADIERMLRGMRSIDKNVAKNMAIRAASERADTLAIERDRKRRGEEFDFSSFITQPVTNGGTTSSTYSNTSRSNANMGSRPPAQKKCIADKINFETGEYTPSTCPSEGRSYPSGSREQQQ